MEFQLSSPRTRNAGSIVPKAYRFHSKIIPLHVLQSVFKTFRFITQLLAANKWSSFISKFEVLESSSKLVYTLRCLLYFSSSQNLVLWKLVPTTHCTIWTSCEAETRARPNGLLRTLHFVKHPLTFETSLNYTVPSKTMLNYTVRLKHCWIIMLVRHDIRRLGFISHKESVSKCAGK